MPLYKDISKLVGNTPIVKLNLPSLKANIFAKLEAFNPLSSVKDRIALGMLEDARKRKLISKGSLIIEPTSGNTGIGLAYISAIRGYRLMLTMSEAMSEERKKLLKLLGAELILTPAGLGMTGAVNKAKELMTENLGAFMPMQFENPANPLTHFNTTAREIWKDMQGKVDIFVAGVGTGGTITGVGEYLKSKNPYVKVIAVEPDSSAVLSGDNPGPHKIQGIGAGFVPKILNRNILDNIIRITSEDAREMTYILAREQGIFAGISAGAAMCGAQKLALLPENYGRNIVTVFPDSGERYISLY